MKLAAFITCVLLLMALVAWLGSDYSNEARAALRALLRAL